jgi:uncharacterized protein YciI
MKDLSPAAMRRLFVLVYAPGAKWLPGKPVRDQPLTAHIEYMDRLTRVGVIVFAGPFLDAEGGGMAIISAPDISRALEIGEGDPAVVRGIMTVRVRLWAVAFATPETRPTT